MKKKIVFTLIIVILISTLFSTCGFAGEKAIVKKEIVSISAKQVTHSDEIKEVKDCDIASLRYDLAEKIDSKEIREILDQETILVIDHISSSEIEQIASKWNIPFSSEEKTSMQTTIGACIRKRDDNAYMVSEIIAEIAKPKNGNNVITQSEEEIKKSLDWLEENAEIDLIQQYSEVREEDERFAALASSSNGSTGQLIGKSFAQKSVYYYLYSTSNPENGYTIYLGSQDSSKYQLAVIHICMIALKTKTDGNRTIDSFVADFTAVAKNGLKVEEFHGKLGTPAETRYNILYASPLSSNSSQSVTTTLSASSDGSASGGTSYSYTYETGGMNIDNHVAWTAYSNWWSARPINPSSDISHTISPSMVVSVSNGVTTTAEARATFSYLSLHKLLTAGWVADQDKVITIRYKNHKEM